MSVPKLTPGVPDDLVESVAAAQLARVHVSTVLRWVMSGKLRGWRRFGRVFVSRADLAILYEPVKAGKGQQTTPPKTRRERARDRKEKQTWADKVLREAGIL